MRQQAESDLLQDDLLSQPSKKAKSIREHHSAANFPLAFWDSLSKVWLTRRALRELDRRNQLGSTVCAQAPARKPARQFSTRKDLQRFARLGGPELDNLRGYSEPTIIDFEHTMSSKRSSSSSRSRHSKSIKPTSNSTPETSPKLKRKRNSAYDANFEQHLIEHGIYMNNRNSKPSNIMEIRRRLARPRPSLSLSCFSEGAFEDFQQKNEDVVDGDELMRDILPTLYGNASIPHKQDLLFTRLESMTSKATVDAKPDFYDGSRLESMDKLVRDDLSPYIIPTGHRTAPVAPNFFIEAKAPDGSASVAKRQITYDLSLGARGMHKLQSYGADKPVFDNNAYTLGATYHAGTGILQIFATHVTPTGPGGSLEYHRTTVKSCITTVNPDDFCEAAAALRNGRDVTKEWRDQFISAANKRARYVEPAAFNSLSYSGASGTKDVYPVEESHTSTDEYEGPEPKPLEDELATSFYPATTSVPVAVPSYPVKESDYDDLSGIIEEPEASADGVALDVPMKPPSSKKHPS